MEERPAVTQGAPRTRAERRRAAEHAARSRAPRPRRRPSVLGILGELLMTVGVVILLFIVWQLWINDVIVRAEQDDRAQQRSETWVDHAPEAPKPSGTDDGEKTYAPIPVDEPDDTEIFGVMHIPRFGDDYAADVAGGVTRSGTLDSIGLGHYQNTQMPGEPGNFALAGHRTTYGKPLHQIADLQVGDAIVLQTEDGWYTYRFRNLEYVTPQQVDVLNPIPQSDAPLSDATESYITLTACSPMYSAAERIIAYGVFESFTPTAEGEPESMDPVNADSAKTDADAVKED